MPSEFSGQCRYSHVAVPLHHCIMVIGGKWKNYDYPFNINTIWMYNTYTEQWKMYLIPEDEISEEWGKHCIPQRQNAFPALHAACAVAIDANVFLFGGMGIAEGVHYTTNGLLKLSRTQQGDFAWSCIKYQSKVKSPSPRAFHTGWEYAKKFWIFGGEGTDATGFLTDNGDFTRGHANNQILCFKPYCEEWTNPECTGNVPEPCLGHSSAILRDKFWLFGGSNDNIHPENFDELYQLDMRSLNWTKIQTSDPKPSGSMLGSLTAISNRQLLLYGNFMADNGKIVSERWIFDRISQSWRKHKTLLNDKHHREGHTGTTGITNGVIIIGGFYCGCIESRAPLETIHVKLEPKSLQKLAVKTIYMYKTVLPWRMLPKSLRYLLNFP